MDKRKLLAFQATVLRACSVQSADRLFGRNHREAIKEIVRENEHLSDIELLQEIVDNYQDTFGRLMADAEALTQGLYSCLFSEDEKITVRTAKLTHNTARNTLGGMGFPRVIMDFLLSNFEHPGALAFSRRGNNDISPGSGQSLILDDSLTGGNRIFISRNDWMTDFYEALTDNSEYSNNWTLPEAQSQCVTQLISGLCGSPVVPTQSAAEKLGRLLVPEGNRSETTDVGSIRVVAEMNPSLISYDTYDERFIFFMMLNAIKAGLVPVHAKLTTTFTNGSSQHLSFTKLGNFGFSVSSDVRDMYVDDFVQAVEEVFGSWATLVADNHWSGIDSKFDPLYLTTKYYYFGDSTSVTEIHTELQELLDVLSKQ